MGWNSFNSKKRERECVCVCVCVCLREKVCMVKREREVERKDGQRECVRERGGVGRKSERGEWVWLNYSSPCTKASDHLII